jgi:hypothetical protein
MGSALAMITGEIVSRVCGFYPMRRIPVVKKDVLDIRCLSSSNYNG